MTICHVYYTFSCCSRKIPIIKLSQHDQRNPKSSVARAVIHQTNLSTSFVTPVRRPSLSMSSGSSPEEIGETDVKYESPTLLPDRLQSAESCSFYDLLNHNIDIENILKEINMEKYIDMFNREEINVCVFCMLTDADLVELKIDEDDRQPMLDAVKSYCDIFNVAPQSPIS